MEDNKDSTTGGRTSQSDIRELRRQLEERMVALGYSAEEREILLNMQPYKADWLIKRLIVFDNKREKVEAYLCDVVLKKTQTTRDLNAAEMRSMAHAIMPELRRAFIRLFSSDEAPALRAQMPLSARAAFMTEKKERVVWQK